MKCIALILCCLVSGYSSKCQSIDKCTALNYFLNSDSVKHLLLFDNNKATFLCDRGNDKTLQACVAGYTGNHSFKWITDSAMAKPVKAHNCAYYFVSCTKKADGWAIEISQACSSVVCQGLVRKSNSKLAALSFLAFVQ